MPSETKLTGCGAEPRWGFLEVALGLALSYGFAIVLVTEVLQLVSDSSRTFAIFVAAFVGQWLGWMTALTLATRWRGSGSFVADFGLKVRRSDIWQGLLLGIAVQIVLFQAIYFLLKALFPRTFDDVSDQAERLTNFAGWQFGVMFVIVVIGAPLLEELFFRGLTQRAFVRKMGVVSGVVVSGTFFGLVHYNGESAATLPALVPFGILLAYLAQRTGRLGLSIFTHIGSNLTTMVALTVERWSS